MGNFINKIRLSPDKYLLALLVFLLPFERIPSIDYFGITWRLSMLVAVVVIIRAMYLFIKSKQKLPLPVIIAIIFIVWMAVTIPGSLNLKRGLSVLGFNIYVIVTALATAYIYKKEYNRALIKSLLLSALIVVLFGFMQYFGNLLRLPNSIIGMRSAYSWEVFGFPRIQSVALEPLYFASYLLLPLAVTMVLIKSKKTIFRAKHWLLLILSLLLSATIFMTVSRGGILGLVILVIFLIGSLALSHLTNWKKILLGLSTVIGGLVLALLLINYVNKSPINVKTTKGKTGVKAYATQVVKTGTEGGGDDRSKFRRYAISIWSSKPECVVAGIGLGQFGPHIQDNKIDAVTGWAIVNNLYLEILVETGIVGLAIFISLVIALFVVAFRALRRERDLLTKLIIIALAGYLLAILVQYLTFSTLYILHFWVAIGLILGSSGAMVVKNKNIQPNKRTASSK